MHERMYSIAAIPPMCPSAVAAFRRKSGNGELSKAASGGTNAGEPMRPSAPVRYPAFRFVEAAQPSRAEADHSGLLGPQS